MQQLSLFSSDRLPHKPYCTDDLGTGLGIRALKSALKRQYIQMNPPHLQFWLTLDVDRAGGAIAWEDANLPVPAFAVANRENGHAHISWALSAPVLTTEAARQAPLRYLNAIRIAYTELTHADRAYSGLITKNPTHERWRLLHGVPKLWDLAELAEYVPDLNKYKDARPADQVGIGRNVSLFDSVRVWSYKEIRLFRGPGRRHFDVWHAHVLEQVERRNADFREPLQFSEVKAIAKSIAKWTWSQDPAAEAKFKAKQAQRGALGGIAKGAANENKRATARLMAAQGMSQRAIASELSVSVGSVNAWLKAL